MDYASERKLKLSTSWQDPTNISGSFNSSSDAGMSPPRVVTPTNNSAQAPKEFKIFLLLLQPKSKIFELIQLLYQPLDTTLGMILDRIPENATEPALGAQEYIGLCRPKQAEQEELLDLDLLASSVRPGVTSAQITLGEILVAIPRGYTGQEVASLSRQILANPKIVKLLKRADPLARKSKRSSSGRRKTRSSQQRSVHVLESHDEGVEPSSPEVRPPLIDSLPTAESERQMLLAMDKAAAEAAAANAAVSAGRPTLVNAHSERKLNVSSAFLQDAEQMSLDDSYSSWSKSFDASFSGIKGSADSVCSGASKRARRRRERQVRRMHLLQRSAGVGVLAMVAYYIMDPRRGHQSLTEEHEEQTQSPMGILGFLQCMLLLLTIYKAEQLLRAAYRRSNPTDPLYMSEERKCPFLKAATQSLAKFKQSYRRRLNKSAANASMDPTYQDDTMNSLPPAALAGMAMVDVPTGPHNPKLRSFKLK
eukprot:Nitzschia sp. Nitz4//scaffold185_size43419//39686//41122//NITZ4_007311-RA/size43419-processed-gene-0.86-mRNA-1//-1//CDS//3329539739//9419//frame0